MAKVKGINREKTSEIREANQYRKLLGLEPLKFTVRQCLKCDSRFQSEGPHNRLCDDCGKLAAPFWAKAS